MNVNTRIATVALFCCALGVGGGVAWFHATAAGTVDVPALELRTVRPLGPLVALDSSRFVPEAPTVAAAAEVAPAPVATAVVAEVDSASSDPATAAPPGAPSEPAALAI